jgi:hypothetical protein
MKNLCAFSVTDTYTHFLGVFMNWYDCEFSFYAYTDSDSTVEVYVYFNIVNEQKAISQYLYKDVKEIGDVLIQARLIPSLQDYMPTQDDLDEWKYEIEKGMAKQIHKWSA